MRRRRDRPSPLEPIFDEEPRRGAINVGNSPGWEAPAVNLVGASVSVSAGTLTITPYDQIVGAIGPTISVAPGALTVTPYGQDVTPSGPTVTITPGTLTVS